MNIRRQKYKYYRMQGLNQYKSAIYAGYSDNYARARCAELEKAENVGIGEWLDKAGLTDKAIAANVRNIAENAVRIHGTDDNYIEIGDHPTRLRALELAAKLKGHLNTKENKVIIVNKMPDVIIGERIKEFAIGD